MRATDEPASAEPLFSDLAELEPGIQFAHRSSHNANPNPLVWATSASDILANVTHPKALPLR